MASHEGWKGDPARHALAAIRGAQTKRRNKAIRAGIAPEQADFNAWYYGTYDASPVPGSQKNPKRVAAGKKSAITRAQGTPKVPKPPKGTPKTSTVGSPKRAIRTAAVRADVAQTAPYQRLGKSYTAKSLPAAQPSGASIRRTAEVKVRKKRDKQLDAEMYGTPKQQKQTLKALKKTNSPRTARLEGGRAAADAFSREFGRGR